MIQPTWQRTTVIWLIKCPIFVKIQNFREKFYFTLRYVFSDIPRQDSDENISLKYTTQGPESKSCMKEACSLGGQHQGPAPPASHYREMLLGKDRLPPPWVRLSGLQTCPRHWYPHCNLPSASQPMRFQGKRFC